MVGHDAVRLEIDDMHRARSDNQAVDIAVYTFMSEGGGNRHFRQDIVSEQPSQIRVIPYAVGLLFRLRLQIRGQLRPIQRLQTGRGSLQQRMNQRAKRFGCIFVQPIAWQRLGTAKIGW